MKRFFIITNRDKDPRYEVTKSLCDYLDKNGAVYELQADRIYDADRKAYFSNPDKVPKDAECILVLGGDGTLLQAARDFAILQIPLLGINLGTLGYLAEISRDSIFSAMDLLLADDYSIEKRMMLEGKTFRKGKLTYSRHALNDIVIKRESPMHLISFENYVDGSFLNKYRADGIIISTPTGSTGYSLSVGGPIVSPEASLIIMTPLAAHTLISRSIIFADNENISVKIMADRYSGSSEQALAIFDGAVSISLASCDRVEVCKSDMHALIIKIKKTSFLETLSAKMK